MVQIDGIVDNAGIGPAAANIVIDRRKPADAEGEDILQIRNVSLHIRKALEARSVETFDTETLQATRIAGNRGIADRNEYHVPAELHIGPDHRHCEKRSRVPVGCGGEDIENEKRPRSVSLRSSATARGARAIAGENVAPSVTEFLEVDRLIRLHAGENASAVRHAFIVDELGSRLIPDLKAGFPGAESEIGILAIGGRVALVKTAKPVPYLAADGERGPRDVIRLAGE